MILPVVLMLFKGENVLVEILLQLLIGIVDVELFKPVYLHEEKSPQELAYDVDQYDYLTTCWIVY